MTRKMGEEFAGFINSLANFGFFVELDDYFIEGLVKLSSLTNDDYDYYEKEYLIKGRRHGGKFRLGDNVRVKVARINAFSSEIDFELLQTTEGGSVLTSRVIGFTGQSIQSLQPRQEIPLSRSSSLDIFSVYQAWHQASRE